MTAFSDETGRGVKLTRAQFIMQMILDYARVYPGAKAKQAMPAAAKIYRDFTESEGIEFGDERYAWDANAAAVLVAEYEDVALEAALSASPVAQEPVATKKVYIKPLRTIVEIQTAYADQIRDWLNTSTPATPAGVGADEIAQIIATKCFDPRVIDSSGKPFWKKSQWREAQQAANAILLLLSGGRSEQERSQMEGSL